ncbi:DUF309 domain-containing protein [Paenibacillus mucilaginosus]|uniref:DUF309 domain-containing protein n=3 Tax=Paenibacillus mucilaginosus TaxID=61624 RepID=H6NA03_9BACL|nr:DUF309 domain-containing protein [Paenibacillus mucilaginosus]AEI40202.1 conserved hypothetical protein [Paenibacillus mucilaginosus KNP414]AFC28847.1 hypothetical protein PM3016_1943 [Paenibacillus mucilaginosus 3016]AFH61023.1 hypothetical protein B2K_09855 [Paenibacillus mucilaginosus K02]MCG7215802.1 DUF309 domain-containing protein [Paenibacillus mucilaginosus]WDM29428.1 DUF309 domain-containing protein [Paenibacillus mucilaginosus]
MAYDRLYVLFVYYFNIARDYFECHEVMEELWLEEGRNPLYQGLLQVAVGLYHYRNGNANGAVKLMSAALEKLEGHPDVTLGIDLKKLREDGREYLEKLLDPGQTGFEFYDLDIRILDSGLEELVEELRQHPPEPHEED